jgi:regulatory protein
VSDRGPDATAPEAVEPGHDRSQEAFERGLAALRRRERGTAELAEWLAGRDFTSAEIGTAIARLTEVGELDDRRFAERFAEDKRELRGWGPERIREALAARGIPRELIDSALRGDDHAEQLARAALLLAKRGQPLTTDAERNRALAFLTRRGYDYELAYEAIRQHGRMEAA